MAPLPGAAVIRQSGWSSGIAPFLLKDVVTGACRYSAKSAHLRHPTSKPHRRRVSGAFPFCKHSRSQVDEYMVSDRPLHDSITCRGLDHNVFYAGLEKNIRGEVEMYGPRSSRKSHPKFPLNEFRDALPMGDHGIPFSNSLEKRELI